MARGRSPILLLVALAALFVLPATAFAQGDPNNPVNTTPATPGAWQTSPYVVTLSGTDVEDAAVDIEWRLGDGGAVRSVASGSQITISDLGVLDFQTQAVDDSGNTSGWRSETLRIDTVDPTDATDSGPAWHQTPQTVQVTAVDITSGVDRVEWILDGGALQSGPNGSDVAISGMGTHTLRTRAVDNAGNVSDWTDHAVNIDNVTPVDTTTLPTGWRTTPVDVSVRGIDDHSGVAEVSWIIDGGAPTSAAPPADFTMSADGAHTIQTLVRDAAGNVSGWKSHSVDIDTTAPTNLTEASDGNWTQGYHVEVGAVDATSGLDRVEWQIDAGPWLNGPSGSPVDITTTGEYQLRTRARDVAGNVSTPRLDQVRVDRTAPTNTTAPAPGGQVSNPYQVAVTGTDPHAGVATVEWQVDALAVQSGASGAVATVSGDGDHTLKTRVIDAVGNASAWRTDTIHVNGALGDNQAPVDTTTTAPSNWRLSAIPVTVSATDAGGVAELQWRIDDQATKSSLTDNPSFAIATEGDHLLETRAIDVAGNASQWRAQHFKVDLSVPVDTTAIPAGWQSTNTFTASATDAYSGVQQVEYRIDGGATQTATNGQAVTVGADGVYTIETRAFDRAGHTSGFRSATLRVDTVDPVNTSPVPDTDWLDAPLELELTGTDARSGLGTMQWRVDGGTIHDGSPAVVDQDGTHTLETRAVDLAGNDTAWRSDTVMIDATAPVNTTPAAPAGWRKTAYSVVVAGDDGAGSGIDVIERTIDGGAVSNDANVTVSGDGVHTLRTRIVDNVGHASTWREDVIRIDGTAPTAAISCNGGEDTWSRAAVTCALGADDGISGLSALTLSRDGGDGEAVASGSSVDVGDGVHVLALSAVDGAGNQGAAQTTVSVDATAPVATLTCTVAGSRHTCRADASDGVSGLAGLGYSIDGGDYVAIDAGGTFAVTKGNVSLRAVDVAGNETVTTPVTLAAPKAAGPTVKVTSVPVYLAGHKDADSLVGALNATRSANGTVSLDLRPLAVGRGRFRVEIAMKAGKRSKRFKRAYTVGRIGTLPRIAASLADATARCTVSLTVRKRAGSRWRRYAATRLVLAK